VTAAIRDITVRKDADKHLAQMEAGIGADGGGSGWNGGGESGRRDCPAERTAESQFGYRRDELLGKKVKSIIPEGFAERLIADGTAPRPRHWRNRSERGLS